MSTQRKSKEEIKKRKWLTLEQKLEIIKCHETGSTIAKIARDKKINESSVRTLLRKKEQIKEHGRTASSHMTKVIVKNRSSAIDKMEALLMLWIKDCNKKQIPINQMIIQAKATSLYRTIKLNEKRVDDKNLKEECRQKFSASRGWLFNFQKRMKLRNVQIADTKESVENDFTERIPIELKEIIENGGYKNEQIFKADKTGLFWKKKPTRTYLIDDCTNDLISFETQSSSISDEIEENIRTESSQYPITPKNEFSLDNLSNFIAKIDDASDFLIQNDPNIKRSIKVRQALQNAIRCYRDMFTEKNRNKSLQMPMFRSHQSFS